MSVNFLFIVIGIADFTLAETITMGGFETEIGLSIVSIQTNRGLLEWYLVCQKELRTASVTPLPRRSSSESCRKRIEELGPQSTVMAIARCDGCGHAQSRRK